MNNFSLSQIFAPLQDMEYSASYLIPDRSIPELLKKDYLDCVLFGCVYSYLELYLLA